MPWTLPGGTDVADAPGSGGWDIEGETPVITVGWDLSLPVEGGWDVPASVLWNEAGAVAELMESAGLEIGFGTDLQNIIEATAARIEGMVGQTFGRVNENRRVSGTGTQWLLLGDAYESISQVATVDGDGATLSVYDPADYVTGEIRGRVRLKAGAWPKDRRNLSITAVWGEDPPILLRQAHLYLSAASVVASSAWRQNGGVKSIQEGGQTTTFMDSKEFDTLGNEWEARGLQILKGYLS